MQNAIAGITDVHSEKYYQHLQDWLACSEGERIYCHSIRTPNCVDIPRGSYTLVNPLTSMSDQDRVSPYIINTMSNRLAKRG